MKLVFSRIAATKDFFAAFDAANLPDLCGGCFVAISPTRAWVERMRAGAVVLEMKKYPKFLGSFPNAVTATRFASSLIFVSLIAGCATDDGYYGDSGRSVRVVQEPAYVYYPDYEVYYDNTNRDYVYYDGRSWITTRRPRREWGRNFSRSPSVHMDFHDSPSRHHSDVIRRYPRHWRPDNSQPNDRTDDSRRR